MAERTDTRTWINRAMFAAVAFAIMATQLVPLDLRPAGWAGPDILLAATLAWIVRKPTYLPVIVIALIFLLADFLFLRPPGLWAGLVVILTEVLRRQHRELRNMPLIAEWGTVAVGIIAITVINRLVIAVVMGPQAPLGLVAMQMAATIVVYPVVIAVTHFIFGVRKAALGEVGSRGQKL